MFLMQNSTLPKLTTPEAEVRRLRNVEEKLDKVLESRTETEFKIRCVRECLLNCEYKRGVKVNANHANASGTT